MGSNGFAIAPAKSASGHPLLLINPHTSFYFRSEVQLTSAAGLNTYGAVTWGSFLFTRGSMRNAVGCTPPARPTRWTNTLKR
nr:penicillin acylase family protein [Hymenobacter sp. BRD67]